MKLTIYPLGFLFMFLLSCGGDPSVMDEKPLQSEREQQVYAQLEKLGAQLSEEEIEKLVQFEKIAEKYDVDIPEEYSADFLNTIDVWLNMSLDDAEGFFNELQTYQLYSKRSTEITRKWYPELKAAETQEKHDELYQEYQAELAQLREDMLGNLERYSERIFGPEINEE